MTAPTRSGPGYLLDVNTLLAVIWINHPAHAKADAWLQGKNLATCPLSELGFLRVSTHPKALKADMPTSRKLLQEFLQKHQPEFVPADLPGLNNGARNSDQVTDLYLAELAASKGLKLATLDTGIRHQAVHLIT